MDLMFSAMTLYVYDGFYLIRWRKNIFSMDPRDLFMCEALMVFKNKFID